MKIIVKEKGQEKPLTIRVPLRMLLNSITAGVAAKHTELSYMQMVKLMRAVKKSAKRLDGIPLIEVMEKNGDEVTIFL